MSICIKRTFYFTTILINLSIYNCGAQTTDQKNNPVESFTLKQCIDYALLHQPALQQSLLNVYVTKATNAINLSGFYPQVAGTAGLTHYIQQPRAISGTGFVQTGAINQSIPGINIQQALFSPSLLYAYKSAPLYVKEAEQSTDSSKIQVVVLVSKSFYNLLLTLQQINTLKEDTVFLAQSVRDAFHQYVGGIVDETDSDNAMINLNNTLIQLKQSTENVAPQYAALKQVMGYPPDRQFNVVYDSAQMVNETMIDTTEQLQYENRIEYKQLATEKILQKQQTSYFKSMFLPTVSAFYYYNYEFENNSFSKLYGSAFPYSYIGLSLNLPIFTGFARVQEVRRSRMYEKQLDWAGLNLQSAIYNEYTSALGTYKSSLYNLGVLEKNVQLSKKVFFIVNLQYKQGIVPYLNVTSAQSNMVNSGIAYLNALFQVLSSKIDLEKAMGKISY
jgi:outer membrane protein TolC